MSQPGWRFSGVGDDVRLAYLEAGPEDGERVVLLHGLPAGAELWRDVIGHLADQKLHVLAPDLPGYGRTEVGVDTNLSMAGLAAIIGRWLDDKGLGPVWVVGHDIGGGVAQVLAVERPEVVSRLTLSDTISDNAVMPNAVKTFQPIARAGLFPALAAARLAPNRYMRRELRRGFADPDRLGGLDIDRVFFDAKFRDKGARHRFGRAVGAIDFADVHKVSPRLGDVEVPVQLLWGQADVFQPWSPTGERLAELLPDPDITLLENSGHFAPMETPKAYADALLAWRDGIG